MQQEILKFWFEDIDPSQWWAKDSAFDSLIADRFGAVHRQAVACELYQWRNTSSGRLAEIIVLDQFSRNLFRGLPQAFAADGQALALAQEAIAAGADKELTPIEQSFLYMPFMHSESAKVHAIAVELFESAGLSKSLDFELRHKRIIDQFGRYPHRNAVLGRQSTPAEEAFLTSPGSSF